MAIKIERDYYSLNEVAKIHNCSVSDLIYLGVQSKLTICFLVSNIGFMLFISLFNNKKHVATIDIPYKHSGLVSLVPHTLRELESKGGFGDDEFNISRFDKPIGLNIEEELAKYCKREKVDYGEVTIDLLQIRLDDKWPYINQIPDGIKANADSLFVTAKDVDLMQESKLPSEIDKPLNTRTENNYLRLIMQLAISNIKDFDPKKPYEAAALIEANIDTELSKKTIAGYITKAHELESKERN